MGLSASQARLLNLTARMHDIEYKAQNLEAQKLQMANESAHVYQEYENALNKQKVQFKQISGDGSATYEDADIQTLLNAGYKIKINVNNTWYQYNSAEVREAPFKVGTYTKGQIYKYGDDYIVQEDTTVVTYGADLVKVRLKWSDENSNRISDTETLNKLNSINFNDVEVLRNLVEAGFIVFEKPDSTSKTGYTEVNIATDTNLQEVSDETELKKAEAKYEADMRKIDAKDKKFDTDLAAMETERNAIKTEIETLKTVAKDNVDRTFKLFS